MQNTVNGSNDELFLSDTLVLVQELLEIIFSSIKSMPNLRIELEPSRNHQISELTVDISRFVEITTLLSKMLMIKQQNMLLKVKESHIHLLFIMKALNQAQQKQDIAALEELIMYELKDNLTQWKIDLIPLTKRLLQS